VDAENTGGLDAAVTSSQRRRIWLCADDFGISPAVNTAIRDLVVRRRLNATSAMVVAPSFSRAEASALDALNAAAPRVAIGLHVALTAPFRPLSESFRPLREGAFLPLAAMAGRALMHRLEPDALAAEITRQLESFIDSFGRAPDFVDGHHHIHLFPQISNALLAVVARSAPNAWLRQCGRVVPLARKLADRKGLVLDILSYRFRRRAAARGLHTNPAFAGTYEFDDAPDFAALFPRFLDRLPDGSVVMCHPGFVDAELQRLDPVTTPREKEYAFLASDGFPAVLASHGVALA
jgi:predicted glycoside hydrolase/deacetylase ChbG (UPF0249 family)